MDATVQATLFVGYYINRINSGNKINEAPLLDVQTFHYLTYRRSMERLSSINFWIL